MDEVARFIVSFWDAEILVKPLEKSAYEIGLCIDELMNMREKFAYEIGLCINELMKMREKSAYEIGLCINVKNCNEWANQWINGING